MQEQEIIITDKYGSKRKHLKTKCKYCNKEFLTRKDWLAKGRGKFCSTQCAKNAKRKKRVTITCATCGKTKEVLPRIANKKTKYGFHFCSVICKNKSQRIGGLIEPEHYKKKSPQRGPKNKDNKCSFCKKELCNHQRRFCSRKCKDNFKYQEYIKKWKERKVSGNYTNGEYLNSYVRRYMLEINNYQCSKCKWNEINPTTGKCPLNINHIDGHSSNSIEENLEVLCPNCHSLTFNYGSLNKGNGRKQRLQKIKNRSKIV